MTRAADLFTDEVLADVVSRLSRRGIDPAWGGSGSGGECNARGRRRMLEQCRQMHRLEARQRRSPATVTVLELNGARGRCAQAVAAQRLCMGADGRRSGAHVRNEFRTIARDRGSPRPDTLPHLGFGPRARSLIESKHVHLPSFITGGRIDETRLRRRVHEEAASIRRQRAELRNPRARAELQNIGLRTLFQIGSLPPHTRGHAALMAEAARIIRDQARIEHEPVGVADADRLRLEVMRHAARRGF
jgi:hypothetical protein